MECGACLRSFVPRSPCQAFSHVGSVWATDASIHCIVCRGCLQGFNRPLSFPCSYLAEQCWNGGFIYLIMLRRFKHQVHSPYNGNSSNSSEPGETPTLELGDRTVKKGKRARKFGVIARPSTHKATEESKSSTGCELDHNPVSELDNGLDPELGNGHAFELENGPDLLKEVAGSHLDRSELDRGTEPRIPKTDAPLPTSNDKRRFSKSGKTDFQSSDCLARVRFALMVEPEFSMKYCLQLCLQFRRYTWNDLALDTERFIKINDQRTW